MVGPAESLNVAMAGTVLCFESARQIRCGVTDPSRARSSNAETRGEGRAS
jgi:hypothetical protein